MRAARTRTRGGWMTPSAPAAGSSPDPRRGSKSSCNSIHPKRPAVVGSTLRDAQLGESKRKRNHDRESEKAKATSSFPKKDSRKPCLSKIRPEIVDAAVQLVPRACSTGNHDGNALLRTLPRAADAASSTRHGIHPRRHTRTRIAASLAPPLPHHAGQKHAVRAFLGQIKPRNALSAVRRPRSAARTRLRTPRAAPKTRSTGRAVEKEHPPRHGEQRSKGRTQANSQKDANTPPHRTVEKKKKDTKSGTNRTGFFGDGSPSAEWSEARSAGRVVRGRGARLGGASAVVRGAGVRARPVSSTADAKAQRLKNEGGGQGGTTQDATAG
ncbi:hypothetical protein B0H13DRAFT_1870104 [Mycena leptocephala]|nr:hypothetical protein B0H13DRAFT_1870104 [Mycena leptocephala]